MGRARDLLHQLRIGRDRDRRAEGVGVGERAVRRCRARPCRSRSSPGGLLAATVTGSCPALAAPSDSSTIAARACLRAGCGAGRARPTARRRWRWRRRRSASRSRGARRRDRWSAPARRRARSRRRPRRPARRRELVDERVGRVLGGAQTRRRTSLAAIEPEWSSTSTSDASRTGTRVGDMRAGERDAERRDRGQRERDRRWPPPVGPVPSAARTRRHGREAQRVAPRASAREVLRGSASGTSEQRQQPERRGEAHRRAPSADTGRPSSSSQSPSVSSATWVTRRRRSSRGERSRRSRSSSSNRWRTRRGRGVDLEPLPGLGVDQRDGRRMAAPTRADRGPRSPAPSGGRAPPPAAAPSRPGRGSPRRRRPGPGAWRAARRAERAPASARGIGLAVGPTPAASRSRTATIPGLEPRGGA